MGLFSKLSGLNKLVEAYPDPAGDWEYPRLKETVEVGRVVYQRCTAVAAAGPGLALRVRGNPPLLVPWGALRYRRTKRLHWRAAHEYDVGDPAITTLTVMDGVNEEMKPFLG